MDAHVVAVHDLVEHVLVEPAPHALGREGEELLGRDGAAKLGQVHEDYARLEVVVRVVHAELVPEVGPHRGVITLDLPDGVRVTCCRERVSGHVHVVELGNVVICYEVGVKVDGLVHVGQQLRSEQAIIGLRPEVPMVGEDYVSEGGVNVKKADAHVRRGDLPRERDHARGEMSRVSTTMS